MAINEALAEYLALYHKGEVNAVTSRELECSFQMRGSELRREINALRDDGIPICSFEGGYYYAATAEELERTIRQLRSRINKIAFAERGLSSALPDYVDTGQMSLPLDGGAARASCCGSSTRWLQITTAGSSMSSVAAAR